MSREDVYISMAIIVFLFLLKLGRRRDEKDAPKMVKKLAAKSREMTLAQFFDRKSAIRSDFAGVYILYNHSRRIYYVGQARRIYKRVNDHFTGHGNGDVYADYKYGDRFGIRLIALKNSGFGTLNALERHAIKAYGAYERGYNKTRGNKG